jgi:hypothetical protein
MYGNFDYAKGAAPSATPTQIPVGEMDVQVTVEVDYTII